MDLCPQRIDFLFVLLDDLGQLLDGTGIIENRDRTHQFAVLDQRGGIGNDRNAIGGMGVAEHRFSRSKHIGKAAVRGYIKNIFTDAAFQRDIEDPGKG